MPFVNVKARSRLSCFIQLATERLRRRTLPAGARAYPLDPVIPPGPLVLDRALGPFVGIFGQARTDVVAGFEVTRRIDEALDMAARAEHEFDSPAEHPRRAITCAPRADVIGHAGDQVEIILHRVQ